MSVRIRVNEAHLRSMSRKVTVTQDNTNVPWTYGLIPLRELSASLTQPHNVLRRSNGCAVALGIRRPTFLPGFCMLGQRIKSEIYVQPSMAAFETCWASMTGDVLKGLDWNHVFVAGGLVLGTMLTPQGLMESNVHRPEEWQASDVDLYIYGLPLSKANDKIKEIAQVYRANLASGAPFLAVRNSQTITFYSTWPTRRVQVVLKLMKTPRDVLLNFDLDPCVIGYDGASVWMLPRFVRALESRPFVVNAWIWFRLQFGYSRLYQLHHGHR